jgi:hypothetical protein
MKGFDNSRENNTDTLVVSHHIIIMTLLKLSTERVVLPIVHMGTHQKRYSVRDLSFP